MLDGDPGLGKSSVAFDLGARLTRGRSMPLCSDPPPDAAAVLLLCAEDSAAETLRPRMEAAGADLTRVIDITKPVAIPNDLLAIEAIVIERGIKLIVIDPVMSFLANAVDSNGDQSSRQALTPLKGLAERTGAAVILVRHLNKKNGDSAAYRGGGSIAFNAAARSALIVGKDPADTAVRVLATVKINVGKEPGPVSYSVGERPVAFADGTEGMMPAVEWGEFRPDLSADDICTRTEAKATGGGGNQRKLADARDWLESRLSAGPVPKSDLEAAAERDGLKWRTIERAADELTVLKPREGFPARTFWRLPTPAHAHVPRSDVAGLDLGDDESPETVGRDHSRQCVESGLAGVDDGGSGGSGDGPHLEVLELDSDDRPEGVR